MNEALQRITAHFDAIGAKRIEVPEWGLTIHTTPVTLAERTRIYSGSKGDNDYEVLVKILIIKARDAQGNPLFTLEDKAILLQKADATVLIRVCAEIMSGGDRPDVAELKN